MTPTSQKTVVICCGVFQNEVAAILKSDLPGLDVRFQSSMLHMKPENLAVRLDSIVEDEIRHGHKVMLVYGDCCMRMSGLTAIPGVARVRCNNCCDLLLGSDVYRRLSREGAFFLLPEWAHRWRHIFSVELGLNHDNAVSLMGDMHKKLVYLDTGVIPIPTDELRACSHYCGLPWEVLQVSLDRLRIAIHQALHNLDNSGDSR